MEASVCLLSVLSRDRTCNWHILMFILWFKVSKSLRLLVQDFPFFWVTALSWRFLCYMKGELYGELPWRSSTPPSAMSFFFWKINRVSAGRTVTLMLEILLTPWPGLCKCKCRLWMHVQCLIFLGRILYNWNLPSPGDESKTNLRIKSHRGIIPKGTLL